MKVTFTLNGFEATPEQKEVVQAVKSGTSLKVLALAGTGKTTTDKLIAKYHKKKTLYVCFNKTVADKANKEMPSHVEARTLNSIAYRRVIKKHDFKSQLKSSLYVYDIKSELEIDSNDVALKIRDVLVEFCNSDKSQIQELNPFYNSKKAKNPSLVFQLAEKYWELAWKKGSSVPITHDFYLKKFQLSKEKLNYELILVDEAQDMNPVSIDIIKNQVAQTVWIGDENQQIYKWRGSVNQLSSLDLPEYGLTHSFRFGEDLAEIANVVLKELQSPYLLTGAGGPTQVHWGYPIENNKPITFIGRTNAWLLNKAVIKAAENNKIYLPTFNETKMILWSAFFLKKRQFKKVRYQPFWRYSSWSDLVEDSRHEKELASIVSLIKKLEKKGENLKSFLDKIEKKLVNNPSHADYLFYTVHKAKGEEWDNVFISPEFNNIVDDDNDKEIDLTEELNILYVALTRAKKNIWLEENIMKQFDK